MNVHQAVEYVNQSDIFKDLKDHYYLAHAFTVLEKNGQAPWQIGYYSKETDKLIVFTAQDPVQKGNEEEAFKKEGHVQKLDEGQIKVTLEDALHIAKEFQKKINSAEIITKTIVILQMLENIPTWNITLITNLFSMINVRVSAFDKTLLKTDVSNVLNLGKRE